MKESKKYYYQVHLTVVLKKPESIYGFINISHIPYSKFEELFGDQVTDERFLFDDSRSYFIKKKLYKKHKKYLDKEVPFTFDFKLFEYSVGLSGEALDRYKKDYYNELPPFYE